MPMKQIGLRMDEVLIEDINEAVNLYNDNERRKINFSEYCRMAIERSIEDTKKKYVPKRNNDVVFSNKDQDKKIDRKPEVYDMKPGRNNPCPCGSGKKYKNCCEK